MTHDAHKKFSKVYGFSNIVKSMTYESRSDVIQYRPKIKLHGTNAAVRITSDGKVTAQKRNSDALEGHYGFAQWVRENEKKWAKCAIGGVTTIIYGEWIGAGIMNKVAASKIPEKQFCIFAAYCIGEDKTAFFCEPDFLNMMKDYAGIERVHVLPWFNNEKYTVDFGSQDNLRENAERFNALVDEIDKVDPYIKEKFGIEGHGEGLVFYPCSGVGSMSEFGKLAFKVKGESHQKGDGGEKKAKVTIEVPEGVHEFADMMVTDARINQAIETLFPETPYYRLERKHVGPVIGWICKDVLEEGKDELEAAGFDWKQVQGFVASKARGKFFAILEDFTF